jgi:hypothetical protein
MSGDHNMNQLREGYRNYDSPVAMPGEFVELDKGITLEEYFAGLNKLYENTGKSVRISLSERYSALGYYF